MWRTSTISFLVTWVGITAHGVCAEAARIVVTGDSLTRGYALRSFLGVAFDDRYIPVDYTDISVGGVSTSNYLGLRPMPGTSTFRQLDQEVLALDADAIVLMLGTNDALRNEPANFRQNMTTILDRFAAARNSRGEAPKVLLMTPIPILSPAYPDAPKTLNQEILPWLREEAAARDLHLLDLNTEIQRQPNWTANYSDGIHLWANGFAGYRWISARVAQSVLQLGLTGFDLPGDFDQDGVLGLNDLEILRLGIAIEEQDIRFDVNHDGRQDSEDDRFWIEQLRGTVFGDANLDGLTDTRDLVQIFQAGEFEDTIPLNSRWDSGDWNGDFEFDTTDLVIALQAGSFYSPPTVAAVPEPATLACALGGLLVCGLRRRGKIASSR